MADGERRTTDGQSKSSLHTQAHSSWCSKGTSAMDFCKPLTPIRRQLGQKMASVLFSSSRKDTEKLRGVLHDLLHGAQPGHRLRQVLNALLGGGEHCGDFGFRDTLRGNR
ncbi:hypothetical protein EYF80_018982 [Liparis tanakae]|uniref:Uncharacterized protein n=1 Tax=Liparis tanakae TaxID=230148 RepID=A0A4Z2HYV5_9TELE|nr:hypothetical protein EYF80_018982 [Liparis tanakae]